MRIEYPIEYDRRVKNDLDVEYMQSPRCQGRVQSASRQDGQMIFADYSPDDYVAFLEEQGIPVTRIDKRLRRA